MIIFDSKCLIVEIDFKNIKTFGNKIKTLETFFWDSFQKILLRNSETSFENGYKKSERAVGKNEKLESLKLESFRLSWKVLIEVGEFSMKY